MNKLDIPLRTNESLSFDIYITTGGSAKNLTGYAAEFYLKENLDDNYTAYDLSPYCTITELSGKIAVRVPVSVVASIIPANYKYDLRVISETADLAQVICYGDMIVQKGISDGVGVAP